MKARILLLALAFAAAPALADKHFTSAEVRKVDKEAGKITLKHGEIANLGMPPMTMVFTLKEPAMADKVKAGDAVKFAAEKVGGKHTVVYIEVDR